MWAGIAQLVEGLTMGWRVRDRILVEVRLSIPVRSGLGAHTSSCTVSIGSLLWQ